MLSAINSTGRRASWRRKSPAIGPVAEICTTSSRAFWSTVTGRGRSTRAEEVVRPAILVKPFNSDFWT